jgi:internalin A
LARLHNLRSLDLSGTLISDVTPLSGLTGLQFLDLTNTPVTDLAPLGTLENLRWLNLRSTRADLSVLSHLSGCRFITSVTRRRS